MEGLDHTQVPRFSFICSFCSQESSYALRKRRLDSASVRINRHGILIRDVSHTRSYDYLCSSELVVIGFYLTRLPPPPSAKNTRKNTDWSNTASVTVPDTVRLYHTYTTWPPSTSLLDAWCPRVRWLGAPVRSPDSSILGYSYLYITKRVCFASFFLGVSVFISQLYPLHTCARMFGINKEQSEGSCDGLGLVRSFTAHEVLPTHYLHLSLQETLSNTSDRDAVVDIVFVHGLGGKRYHTWTKNGVLWPRDLLAEDFPRARIMTVS